MTHSDWLLFVIAIALWVRTDDKSAIRDCAHQLKRLADVMTVPAGESPTTLGRIADAVGRLNQTAGKISETAAFFAENHRQ